MTTGRQGDTPMELGTNASGVMAVHETVGKWLNKSREELDEIYRHAEPGTVPAGDTRGTAIVAGSRVAVTQTSRIWLRNWGCHFPS